MFKNFLKPTNKKQQILAHAYVMPDSQRCVQCGICSYNCPIGIDVRQHALQGLPVEDSQCLTCGECVKRCPRSVLHFEYDHTVTSEHAG